MIKILSDRGCHPARGAAVAPLEVKYCDMKKLEVRPSYRGFPERYHPQSGYIVNKSLCDEAVMGGTRVRCLPYRELMYGRFFRKENAMRDVDYVSVAEESINKIKAGAFLTVKSGQAMNTMTIGWATFGVVWNRPIMMVAVRSSRHTFGIIEAAEDFTVTVPAGNMHEETAFCGSNSGRNVDKFKKCNLETIAGRQVASPVIKTPGRHYECKIIYKTPMDPVHFDKGYDASLYPGKDYHTLYFGEIMTCYETD